MASRALHPLTVTSHLPPPNNITDASYRLPRGTLIFKTQPLTLSLRPIGITPLRERERERHSRRRWIPVANVVEESQESSESEEQQQQQQQPVDQSELASELKKAMQERKEKEGEDLWSGVAQEIREIEWPSFGKVLVTSGVVLSVILGSSVVLVTVNAVLAELSDKVFAGKGVQDFFT